MAGGRVSSFWVVLCGVPPRFLVIHLESPWLARLIDWMTFSGKEQSGEPLNTPAETPVVLKESSTFAPLSDCVTLWTGIKVMDYGKRASKYASEETIFDAWSLDFEDAMVASLLY